MAWKIMENLENEKSIFQTWKNHGIWKRGQNHGKVMEFQNISMEKSWGKILRSAHSVQYRHTVYTIITVIVFINNFWIRGCNETTFKTQLSFLLVLKLVIVVACRSWKNDARVMENHGIWFRESNGNPDIWILRLLYGSSGFFLLS